MIGEGGQGERWGEEGDTEIKWGADRQPTDDVRETETLQRV